MHRLRLSQKAFITAEEIRSPRRAAWAVRVIGRGAGGRTPVSHVWAVSDQQVCSVQESRHLGLYVCLAQEVSLKAPPGHNKGQQLHRHQLKMEIELGSLHQDTLHPDHHTQGEVHWGLLDGLSEIRCF